MKEKILEIYNSYLIKNPELKNERCVILCMEGLGAYQGKARKECSDKHPRGRMGAIFAIIGNGELFYTSHCSTLPDDPQGPGKYNGGTPVPTVQVGIYDVYGHLHKNKYPAMELGKGSEKIEVIRNTGPSTSIAINIHGRGVDDLNTFAWSTGCIGVLENRFNDKLEQAGVTKNGKYLGKRYIGKLIIDRSNISEDLQELYKDIYGPYYTKVFNAKEVTELDYYKQQVKDQEERIKDLTKDLFNRDMKINEQQETIKIMKAKAKEIGEM